MRSNIISRENEIKELLEIYNSKSSEFVVVYGRRRVGKTFLVRELFENKFTFYHTAVSPIEFEGENLTKVQIKSFCTSMITAGANFDNEPKDWFEVFEIFKDWFGKLPKNKRKVIFIDELPWLDTNKSGFVSAFENLWNSFLDGKNVMLVVSGSAVAWINDNLINSYGGLYNRVTREIALKQFTLKETEDYLKSKNITMGRTDILEIYMAIGGIPFYLSHIRKGLSVSQNIDNLFFNPNARLQQEFNRLFRAQFKNYDTVEKILKFLSGKRIGYTRKEISDATGIAYNGLLTTFLKALEVSQFVTSYVQFSQSKRDVYYKLTDFFVSFWLYFKEKKANNKDNYWLSFQKSSTINTWRGLSFEQVCFVHKAQIKKSLGILGVSSETSTWISKKENNEPLENRAQIDMLITRADNVVNICEMKYSNTEYSITKSYDKELRDKIDIFCKQTKTKLTPQLTLVTTYGLKQNEYSGLVQSVVTLDDLYRSGN